MQRIREGERGIERILCKTDQRTWTNNRIQGQEDKAGPRIKRNWDMQNQSVSRSRKITSQ